MAKKLRRISRAIIKSDSIDPEQKAMMRDLLRVGATSASKFEINTNRISKKTSEALNALVTKGLIGKTETNIFYPTLQTWLKVYLS